MAKLKHGHARRGHNTTTYQRWLSMIRRCTYPSQQSYYLYGGRGIKVCDRWLHSYENFLADMGPCPNCALIERINNDGHYEPDNCIWTSDKIQGVNRRNNHRLTFQGETKTLSQWARQIGLKERTLRARIVDHGWTIARALTATVRPQRRHGAPK